MASLEKRRREDFWSEDEMVREKNSFRLPVETVASDEQRHWQEGLKLRGGAGRAPQLAEATGREA